MMASTFFATASVRSSDDASGSWTFGQEVAVVLVGDEAAGDAGPRRAPPATVMTTTSTVLRKRLADQDAGEREVAVGEPAEDLVEAVVEGLQEASASRSSA